MFILFVLFYFGGTLDHQPIKVVHRENVPHILMPAHVWYRSNDEQEAYWSVLQSLVSNREKIYIVGKASSIFEIDYRTKVSLQIGRIGQGPSEYQPFQLGMAVFGHHLWLMDQTKLLHYKKNVFQTSFISPVPDWRKFLMQQGSGNRMTSIHDLLIVPAGRSKTPGEIGLVIDQQGQVIHQLVDPSFDKDLLTLWSPFAINVNWDVDDQFIYACYSSIPRVAKFDHNFEFKGYFEVRHPEISQHLEKYFYNRKLDRSRRNNPVFYDFQVHQNTGFVISNKNLYAFDLETGSLLSVFLFQPTDRENYEAKPYGHQNFTIMPDNRIILGGPRPSELLISSISFDYLVNQEVLDLEYEDQ